MQCPCTSREKNVYILMVLEGMAAGLLFVKLWN